MFIRILLIGLISVGLWGAGNLSFQQLQTGAACPILGNVVPACYIAFGGYLFIGVGAVLSLLLSGRIGRYLFWIGTAIAGGLAALATVLELFKGDVCPAAFDVVPMCYLSLGFSILIAGLYVSQFRNTTPAGLSK